MAKSKADSKQQADKPKKKKPTSTGSGGLYGLAHGNTRLFVGIAAVIGLFGLGYFLFFPFVSLLSAAVLYVQFSGEISWVVVGIASLILVSSGLMSYRIFDIAVPMPAGVKLEQNQVPKLFEFIDEQKAEYPKLKIDNVIFTDRFEIQILKTPVCGFPVWSRNTLAIGLPVMLCLPPEYFRLLLIRKLGQFTKRRNPVTNWLYQFHQIMHDYEKVLERDKGFDRQLFLLFFRVYLPSLNQVAPYVAQLDELSADLYAMDQVNHEDVVQGLEMEYLMQRFLEDHYQPKVQQYVEQNPKASPFYCARLTGTVQQSLPKLDIKKWLLEAQEAKGDNTRFRPRLMHRLNNIGHDKVNMNVKFPKEMAANILLGEAYYRALKVVDMFWSRSTADIWRKEAEIRQKEKAIIAKLQRKGTESRLTFRELMQYLSLMRKHSPEPVTLPFYRYITGKLPKAA